MSTAALVSISHSRHLHDLDEQRRALGAAAPERLVVCCSEPDLTGPPAWRHALGPALELHSPGASLDDAGLQEALHFAVLELGVQEVVLALHSRCSHLEPEPGPQELADELRLPFMERLHARRARSRRQLANAKERVRAAMLALAADPVLERARRVGLVHIVESGVLLTYDADRDEFEALL